VKEVNQLQGGRRIQSAGTEKPATRIWVASRGWFPGRAGAWYPTLTLQICNLKERCRDPRLINRKFPLPRLPQLTPPCAVREAGFFVFRR
jgi:hypothetical protein